MSGALLKTVRERSLVVCVGSGGVGKTSTAAALAIRAAQEGRRTLVITIDPARRLANALGLEEIGNTEHRIAPELYMGEANVEGGDLHAMMLDTRTVFDQVIHRISPDQETLDRILENGLYRNLSENLSASQEYMATEKLYDVYQSKRYDLIVLDTPPMKNALDFLDSPGRFTRFLDDKIMGWFLNEGLPTDELGQGGPLRRLTGLSKKVLSSTGALAYSLLSVVFGTEFLVDLREFFLAFKDLYKGFRQRSEAVIELMADAKRTQFVVVCSPRTLPLEEAAYFHGQLKQRKLPRDMVVVNQAGRYAGSVPRPTGGFLSSDENRELSRLLSERGIDDVAAISRLEGLLLAGHKESMEEVKRIGELRRKLGRRRTDFTVVPRLRGEVNDIQSLLQLSRYLFAH